MGVPNGLDDLERQRLELEGNVRKLQESLYHWRTWEAEYDGLKDEINTLSNDATTDDFLQIGRDFGGTLVNEEEIKVLLGGNQGVSRSKEQVTNLITRRIDYVKQNVATMEKRLQTAEIELGALDAIDRLPSETGPEFPMSDIMEELDEEGNVISSSVNTPGDHAPELLDVLKRAGVKDIPDGPRKDGKSTESRVTEIKEEEEDDFQPEEKREQKDYSSETPQFAPVESGRIAQDSQTEGEVSSSVDQLRERYEEQPVTEVDESPEDAQLRREMLEYGLNEVGAVVAELELDDDASDVSLDDGSYEYDSEEDEEEDEHGRSTKRVLSDDYHQQMRELEAKLNARGMYNMGKDAGALPTEVREELEQRPAVNVNNPVSEKKPKKKVAFAEDVDIAPSPKKPPPEKKAAPRQPEVSPISDSIVERTESAEKALPTAEAPKKASRFKSARHTPEAKKIDDTPVPKSNTVARPPEVRSTFKPSAPANPSLPLFSAKPEEPKPFSQPISDITETPSAPQPPKDKILADKLVERETPEAPAAPPELDELDDKLHRKEIATEFYHMRNRMIQQNGGFTNDDEAETVPIETDDAPKRVSRFKAARMG